TPASLRSSRSSSEGSRRAFPSSRRRTRVRSARRWSPPLLGPKQQVLFNPGPVNLAPEIKESLFNVELSHRQPEFEELAGRVKANLFRAGGIAPDSHRLSLLHGSGGLAVDAALSTFVRGTVLVLNNGLYCERI